MSTSPLTAEEIAERQDAYDAMQLGRLGMPVDMVCKAIDKYISDKKAGK